MVSFFVPEECGFITAGRFRPGSNAVACVPFPSAPPSPKLANRDAAMRATKNWAYGAGPVVAERRGEGRAGAGPGRTS
jgi:hypothetical protein